MRFGDLDDLVVQRVLSYITADQLLHLARLCANLRLLARSDEAWTPPYLALRRAYPLAFPISHNNCPHVAARCSMARLKAMPVKGLRELAQKVALAPRSIAACSEKGEICKLIFDQQLAFRVEMTAVGKVGGRAFDRTWETAFFASYWCTTVLHHRD